MAEKTNLENTEVNAEYDYVYIMDIYKSRENKEDYPNVTSKLILDNLKKAEHIDENAVSKLLKYKNSIILFMSPNDLSNMQKKYIKEYKNIDK